MYSNLQYSPHFNEVNEPKKFRIRILVDTKVEADEIKITIKQFHDISSDVKWVKPTTTIKYRDDTLYIHNLDVCEVSPHSLSHIFTGDYSNLYVGRNLLDVISLINKITE